MGVTDQYNHLEWQVPPDWRRVSPTPKGFDAVFDGGPAVLKVSSFPAPTTPQSLDARLVTLIDYVNATAPGSIRTLHKPWVFAGAADGVGARCQWPADKDFAAPTDGGFILLIHKDRAYIVAYRTVKQGFRTLESVLKSFRLLK